MIKVQGYMKSIGVLKGEEDEELRRTTFDAMNMFYNEHGSMYAQLLNLLAGFRITSYNDSGNSEVLFLFASTESYQQRGCRTDA